MNYARPAPNFKRPGKPPENDRPMFCIRQVSQGFEPLPGLCGQGGSRECGFGAEPPCKGKLDRNMSSQWVKVFTLGESTPGWHELLYKSSTGLGKLRESTCFFVTKGLLSTLQKKGRIVAALEAIVQNIAAMWKVNHIGGKQPDSEVGALDSDGRCECLLCPSKKATKISMPSHPDFRDGRKKKVHFSGDTCSLTHGRPMNVFVASAWYSFSCST